MELTGAQALVKSLEMQEVEVIFGLPGGAILPGIRPDHRLADPPHPRSPRAGRGPHGRGLRAGDRPPGRGDGDERPGRDQRRHAARRRLHGLDPLRRASPARWPRARSGPTPSKRATRPASPSGSPSTTGSSPNAADIPQVVREAFHIATTGRPGPVLIDFPKDVANSTMEWYWPDGVDLPGYRPPSQARPGRDRGRGRAHGRGRAAGHLRRGRHLEVRCLRGASRARRADGHSGRDDAHGPRVRSPTAIRCASACRACTATTPPSPPCRRPTCCVALGSRFDDRVTGKVSAFAPEAKVVHVDIDKAEIGKVRRPEVGDPRRLPPGDRGA